MGKIFHIMGKGASGKDSIFKELLKTNLNLIPIIPYTTRPKRENEIDGVEYHFVSNHDFENVYWNNYKSIIEYREYNTDKGKWKYYTLYDNFDLQNNNYIYIGTLETYQKFLSYFAKNLIEPIYIEISDKNRIHRMIGREDKQKEPNYNEVCRRFLADKQDFSKQNLEELNILNPFMNDLSLDITVENIYKYIQMIIKLDKENSKL